MLPVVVAVAALTDISLPLMLVWFGVFQIVCGFYYGVPVSVEPMKALAAFVLTRTLTTGEFLLTGMILGVVLVGLGATQSLGQVSQYIGRPVVRGVQFGVALLLFETGLGLSLTDLPLASLAVGISLLFVATKHWNMSAFAVLIFGGSVTVFHTGVPSPTVPTTTGMFHVDIANLTRPVVEATVAQLAMTVGNAALATSVLLSDYFDRDISADELSASMGVMNLVAIPLGAIPMCHGSGGVAGKYGFGARTGGANVILGSGYILVAVLGAGIVATYPLGLLGVILALIAVQLGRTSLQRTQKYGLVLGIGILAVLSSLGVAFVVGVAIHLLSRRWRETY